MSIESLRETLTRKLVAQRPIMAKAARYYTGTQPLPAMDPEIASMLAGRVPMVNVNLARLAVDVYAQRLTVVGFASSPDDLSDNALWDLWLANDMDTQSQLGQLDALVHGRAYFLAWVGPEGDPRITVESPMQCAVTRDPLTGAIVGAIKRWIDEAGYVHSLIFTAEEIVEYVTRAAASPDPLFPTDALPITGEDMVEVARQPNALGVVPLVALVNRPRLQHPDGESEIVDIMPLIDGISKLSIDLQVASEYSASPRRWVTGLLPDSRLTYEQAEEVAQAIKTQWETAYAAKILIAPDHRTEFGSFEVAALDNYQTAITLLTQQVAALAALPPYYLTLNTANPTSADSIRASEARLTAKAERQQRLWGPAFADLMRLAVLVRDGRPDPRLRRLTTQWASAAPSTLAQTADAEAKLVGAGIVDRQTALLSLGYTPLDVERITANPIERTNA
jgi:hypothetical protein